MVCTPLPAEAGLNKPVGEIPVPVNIPVPGNVFSIWACVTWNGLTSAHIPFTSSNVSVGVANNVTSLEKELTQLVPEYVTYLILNGKVAGEPNSG